MAAPHPLSANPAADAADNPAGGTAGAKKENDMIRKFILASAIAAVSGSAALAHATLEQGSAPAGTSYKAVIRVPHGCDGAPTNVVRVRLPQGYYAVKPMPKPGWTLEKIVGDYETPYDNHGTEMTEGVTEIVWSGGNLPDDEYDEFIMRGSLGGNLEVGETIWFQVVQDCPEGASVRWIEIPAEGQTVRDLAGPALGLTITEKQGAH
jgi:uncharacterized protein YcnI